MRPFGRRRPERSGAGDPILIVGLGNPGSRYQRTRHNAGFEVLAALAQRWQLGRARDKFGGRWLEGRAGPGGPRVALLQPLTFMNESGRSAGPARGSLRISLDRVIALHDEIDIPFGQVRVKQGGGVAGHNGLKSLKLGFGSADFWRIRVGVGRPEGTDPEIVSRHVLSRFSEPREEVLVLIEAAAGEAERLVDRIADGQRS